MVSPSENKIQTHKRLKKTLKRLKGMLCIGTKQHANFRGNPLHQATKRHLHNSEAVKMRCRSRIPLLLVVLFSCLVPIYYFKEN